MKKDASYFVEYNMLLHFRPCMPAQTTLKYREKEDQIPEKGAMEGNDTKRDSVDSASNSRHFFHREHIIPPLFCTDNI